MTGMSSGGTDDDDDPAIDREAGWRQVTQRHYDRDRDGELTTAIVFAIADAENVPIDEVKSPPLYEVVDIPAIEAALFRSETRADPRKGTGSVEFRYTDYLVKVRSDGWIQLYEADETQLQ